MADSSLDTRIRGELLAMVRPLAIAAVTRLENATSQLDADLAASDMKRFKSWLDWLEAAGTGRGARVS